MKPSKILIAVVAVALIASVAIAAYAMRAPDSPQVIVNDKEGLTTVSVDRTVLTVGEQLTLSTTSTDGLVDLAVTFYYSNGVAAGTVNTDAYGIATLTFQPVVGSWTFYATAEHP